MAGMDAEKMQRGVWLASGTLQAGSEKLALAPSSSHSPDNMVSSQDHLTTCCLSISVIGRRPPYVGSGLLEKCKGNKKNKLCDQDFTCAWYTVFISTALFVSDIEPRSITSYTHYTSYKKAILNFIYLKFI
jgi:hypothetical protein